MPYVICEPCINVKEVSCVDVCPVDAIHPRKDEGEYAASDQLFIDPDTCIECGACEAACPVQAIYQDSGVPEKWKSFIKKNAEHYA